jgi:branched-chain amino acid aminotransferase
MVHETRLTLYDVYTADEIFVTGSGAGIVAVTEVDKRVVSEGKIGQVTRILSDLYDEEAKMGESAYE